MRLIPCHGCRVVLPERPGPVHDVHDSSEECWALYGDMLAREYQDPAYFWVHGLTVDTYAAQHPGGRGRRAAASTWLHLAMLHVQLERGVPPKSARPLRRRFVGLGDLQWLEPPRVRGTLTVEHLVAARTAEEHVARVEEWAASVWQAWSPHHDAVREFAERNLVAAPL